MLNLPESTEVHKPLQKVQIYRKFQRNARSAFVFWISERLNPSKTCIIGIVMHAADF